MKSLLKKVGELVNIPLEKVGLSLIRKDRSVNFPTWVNRLKLAKNLGFSPDFILDGGAFKGTWSQKAAEIFPGSKIVLVEPNPNIQDQILENISGIHPEPVIIEEALGESKGKANLNIWGELEYDTGASLLSHVAGEPKNRIEIKVETIDHISEKTGVFPDLIKLDLQGAELSALKGAEKSLEHAEMVISEFGCLEAYERRTTPLDLMKFMYSKNYCLYDIVDCHYRPYDNALTGGDFFFVKNDSILREHKGYL